MEEALEGVEEGGEGAEEGEEGRRYFCGDGLLGGHGGWGGKSAETETTRNVHGRDRGDAGHRRMQPPRSGFVSKVT